VDYWVKLLQSEEELLRGVFPPDGSKANEASQYGNDLATRKFGKANYLIQRMLPLHDIK
jgi:hypothetical protein